ncbi:uncharacterized protein LOC130844888 [Hippopotamus amphibius kiboko]|uniref:uncharacterized protein LOC130844888 n=1 Tax=Hippopotamus amphibius kiboko TaxID=575201 RepID=UPI002595650D|nr:uncharacterized protein LOC130844888 [Hippopotamus amphibius kiboko]
MQRICSLIHLTLYWAGVMSAVVLVPQDQVRTVFVGESVTLTCSMKGESISNYYTFWYRKTPGDHILWTDQCVFPTIRGGHANWMKHFSCWSPRCCCSSSPRRDSAATSTLADRRASQKLSQETGKLK